MKVDDGDGLLTMTPVIHSRARVAVMREIGMEENAGTVAEKTERENCEREKRTR